MARLRRRIAIAARGHGPILLVGESGTGKELVARAIHALSAPGQAFVPVNCAALPAALIEGELFGYSKGAYTGATERHDGLVMAAANGVLLLDEITEMPLHGQAKLLRLLDDGLVRRVGSTDEIAVRVRFIASTNRFPDQAVSAGLLRADLYHRLNVHQIRLPSLSERVSDIPELVSHFSRQLAQNGLRKIVRVDKAALRALQCYRWPGNVRELRNAVESSLSAGDGATLELGHLPDHLQRSAKDRPHNEDSVPTLAEAERALVIRALSATRGNKLRAARLLGISRHALYNKLRKFEIQLTDDPG